ncbi:MAG: selenide, water dikinase SelD [Hyphomicrobiales bacterium]|nr:selenide, water dikinase SelD [Hyphomicrobiales bacterium]
MSERRQHLVLAGAGHAHVIALRAFIKHPPANMRITLVTREVMTPYSGMLPGVIAGHYPAGAALIDTRPLAQAAGAELVEDEVTGLDPTARRVALKSGGSIGYDFLSIDVGSQPTMLDVPGAVERVIPVKPIDHLLREFAGLEERFRLRGHQGRIAVVGGGAGGTELAFSISHRLRETARLAGVDPSRTQVTIIAGERGLLPDFPAGFRSRVARALEKRHLLVRPGQRVRRVEAGCLFLDDGARVSADEILWTTQAAAASWIAVSGLATDDAGFIAVDAHLRSLSHDNVFAAGDVASFTPRAIPKSGVYAVRAGPVLAENLRCAAARCGLQEFKPQEHVLYILSTGDRNAVATRNGISVSGRICWMLKDWIDRGFISRFTV